MSIISEAVSPVCIAGSTISTDGGAELYIFNSYSWPGYTPRRPPGTFHGHVPGAQLDALWSYIREHELLEHGYLDREGMVSDGVIETLKLVDGSRTAEYHLTDSPRDPAFTGLVKRLDELALALASQSP